jgi:hypothetical protein
MARASKERESNEISSRHSLFMFYTFRRRKKNIILFILLGLAPIFQQLFASHRIKKLRLEV